MDGCITDPEILQELYETIIIDFYVTLLFPVIWFWHTLNGCVWLKGVE